MFGMDMRQLRYFVAICNFKNLAHAADHCNVAASALSHHIANLEAELEVSLFRRKPRGMEPTAAGLKLLGHAQQMLGAMESAISDVRHGHAELSGQISIGMPFSVIKVIGSDLMRTVLSDYPKVRLLIREGFSGVTYDSLLTSQVETALIFNPPADSQTVRIPLLEEELFCIGHTSIIGDTTEPIPFDAMTAFPLALLQTGTLSRALLDKPAALSRLESQANIQLASIAGTLSALTEGLACTLAPRVLVTEHLRSGHLNARPVTDPKPTRTLYIVRSDNEQPTFLLEMIEELMTKLVSKAIQDGRWEAASLISP